MGTISKNNLEWMLLHAAGHGDVQNAMTRESEFETTNLLLTSNLIFVLYYQINSNMYKMAKTCIIGPKMRDLFE